MNTASAIVSSLGKDDEAVTLANIVGRLKAIEDIVWPMQPVPKALTTLEDTAHKQGQQQIALNLALTHFERQD
jgi:hypothetical protein